MGVCFQILVVLKLQPAQLVEVLILVMQRMLTVVHIVGGEIRHDLDGRAPKK